MPSRPAVSTMTTSKCLACASARPSAATLTGSAGAGVGGAFARCAGVRREDLDAGPLTDHLQLVDRAGALQVAATSSGVWPCPRSHLASLPARVVLPEPCRPASMITVGGVLANASWRVSPPRMPTSSSLTILTTCWAGFSAADTSAPLARSLMRVTNARTTGSETSASSSASRISRVVASMSASVNRPLPRSPDRTPVNRSERDSNTRASLAGFRHRLRGRRGGQHGVQVVFELVADRGRRHLLRRLGSRCRTGRRPTSPAW